MRLNDWPFPVYGDVTYRGKCPREEIEQVTFFNRIRNEYPDSYGRLALHPRNEAKLKGGQFRAIVKHRAEGMATGASDIIIPGAVTFVCELKRRDHTKSDWEHGQPEYLIAALNMGAFACVALGCDAAWQAFTHWRDVCVRP